MNVLYANRHHGRCGRCGGELLRVILAPMRWSSDARAPTGF